MTESDDFINKNWIYILFFIFINYCYFHFNIDKNTSIKSLIQFYGSFGFLLTIINMYQTSINQYAETIKTQVNYYNSLFDQLNTNIYNFFKQYPEMKYYYDELYNENSNYDENIRNKYLEQLLSNQIFGEIDSFVNYIDSFKTLNKNTKQLFITEEKLKKTLKRFFKSKIFLEQWLYFRKTMALKWTKDYVDMFIQY